MKIENNYFDFEFIGNFQGNIGWIHPKREINSYELIYVTGGTLYIFENDVKYEVRKDEIILLNPHKAHGGYKKSEEKTSFYWFHFRTDLPVSVKMYTGEYGYDIKYLLKKLLHFSNSFNCPQSLCDAVGYSIYEELVYRVSDEREKESSVLNEIFEYVRINAANGVNVRRTAKHFGYSPDYLGKIFKKKYKVGLNEYIVSQKINYAKDLLITTTMSVKEISALSSVGSYNAFIKFFVYHEGITPSEFRNKYCNTHLNNK